MPKLSANSVAILDGAIVLTRRNGSAQWQARFKVAGRWLRVSTKCGDLSDAKKAATELYYEAKFKEKHHIPIQSKRFKDVAKLAIDRMENALAAREGKIVYRDYIQAINNYLIPFFGNYHVATLTYPDIQRFSDWRTEKLGRALKASTLGTHNSALNYVFNEAVKRGYIAQSNVPVLENKGVATQRRPAFSIEECEKIFQALPAWVGQARGGKSRAMRELLLDYVQVLLSTGMRHGTEAQNLRWRHIYPMGSGGTSYVLMSVKGKTKRRELVAQHACVPALKRIHARCPDIAGIEFDQFIEARSSDLPVFRLPTGETTKHLGQTFEAFLKHVGLLIDPDTGQNRTLYSLRHTYATVQVLEGVELHLLARQMGTSTAMLEKHYSHLQPRMKAQQLAGKAEIKGNPHMEQFVDILDAWISPPARSSAA